MQQSIVTGALVLMLAPAAVIAQDVPTKDTPPPTTAPAATQPTALEQLKAQERKAIEDRAADTPVVGPHTVNQVVRLGIRDNRLTAHTSLTATEGDKRIDVSDATGYWRAVVHGQPGSPLSPSYFVIEKYDFTDPAIVFSHAQVLASPNSVQVVGDWEYADGALHVELLDSPGAVDPDEGVAVPGSITLFVNGYDNEGGRNVQLRLRAPDLKTLRREHPREVSAYLRPVLRELQADELVAIDSKLAWQVLGTQRKPDSEMEQRVRQILPKLDADEFTVREQAAQALRDLGVEGALVMLQMDRTKLSPEQNAHVEEVIAAYHQAAVKDVSKLADDLDFLLDVLLTDDPAPRRMALDRIHKRLGRDFAFDLDAPLRQRADRVAQLRDELLPPPATQAVEQ